MHNLVVLLFPLPCLFSFPHLSLFCPLWFPYCCHLTWSHVSPLYLNTSNPVPHFCFLDLCPQSYPHRHTYITNKNLVPPHKREHALLVFATLTHYNNFQNCFFSWKLHSLWLKMLHCIRIFLIYSSLDGHVGPFYFLTIAKTMQETRICMSLCDRGFLG